MANSSRRSYYHTNEDRTHKISYSVYVTNFLDSITSRDLWSSCSAYGTVVDVFIPFKKSKAGKRFAFVRFIKVVDLARLVKNLCTIWIGRHHLYANQVRFERPPKSKPPTGASVKPFHPPVNLNGRVGSYTNVVNGRSPIIHGSLISPSPALVLDDTCLVKRDLSKYVMGKVKDFMTIPNLYTILKDEGFADVNLSYLGGGKTLDMEDNADSSFGNKRVCIMTKHPVSILETFKIIAKGKVYMVRAKELFTWNPNFTASKEEEIMLDDESCHASKNDTDNNHPNDEASDDESASDVDDVSDTVFGPNSPSHNHVNEDLDNSKLEDPFGVYDLLNKQDGGIIHESSPSIPHPPGFTPAVSEARDEQHTVGEYNNKHTNEIPKGVSAKVMYSPSQEVPVESNSEAIGQNAVNNGGSVLGVMEDVIRVGQAMGYAMEGCTKKEWVKALINSNKLNFLAIQETKMSSVSHLDVKFLWGNSNYDFVCSDSLGSSGGILCIWEASIFKKDNVTISDNFIAIYGTWLPNNAKILFIAVYAPQQCSYNRILWDYISTILSRWNGESIIMGDFNEVRSSNERRGSCFNPYNARCFDRFISNSDLVDINIEGYAFTWSHHSASKMSKLDRFLVSDGIFTLFPSITAICLDRHLSDHRLILLCEVHLDFGPIPFRFYHSWFNIDGFEDLIKRSWLSFSHSNANRMIRFKKKLQDLEVLIRQWIKTKKSDISSNKHDIVNELREIDKKMDRGEVDEATVRRRFELKNNLIKINDMEAKDNLQNSKVKWAIEGDENSKFFHGIINKRRSQLAIRRVFVDGIWCSEPDTIKDTFLNHFVARFSIPPAHKFKLSFQFQKRLTSSQAEDLE
nr:RNA-directed DNA polymerase, eukaryota [Tanacetum cinerariifolium]